MNKQHDALRLAELLEFEALYDRWDQQSPVPREAAAELRRLHHNNRVLMDALWKACGDDEDVVNATIESQGDLK